MSDYIDTREGWRRMLAWETADGRDMLQYEPNGDPEKAQLWVREAPVPPLPPAPYTVIHVTWLHASPRDYSAGVLMRRPEGDWEYEPGVVYEGDDLHGDISGFEVLSEPRAVTAKAVLDRLAEITAPANILTGGAYHDVGREFGVES